jgi:hypothetical protein
MAKNFAEDYVTVADRITAFYKAYPEGSLQSVIVELTDKRVVVRGEAYRNAEDPRPGVGHSALAIPGATPYTRGSEIENAETSAWGRAIAALGFETKAGIASRDEIDMKATAQSHVAPRPAPDTAAAPIAAQRPGNVPLGEGLTLGQALEALKNAGIDSKVISAKGRELFGQWSLKEMTPEQRAEVVQALTGEAPAPTQDDEDWGAVFSAVEGAK